MYTEDVQAAIRHSIGAVCRHSISAEGAEEGSEWRRALATPLEREHIIEQALEEP
jgi:hypothetical protein